MEKVETHLGKSGVNERENVIRRGNNLGIEKMSMRRNHLMLHKKFCV